MRALGIDVGERRTGVAAGDTETGVAVPVGVANGSDARAAALVAHEAESRGASVIVVGMPYAMSGRIGAQARAVEEFVALLRSAVGEGVEVVTVDERLSTAQAERSMARPAGRGTRRAPSGAADASAAAIILQSWLDAGAY